jgi:hypothetical protein
MAHFRVAGDETTGRAPDYHVATDDACGRILGLPTGGLRREFDWPATPAGRFGIGAKPHGNSVCAVGAIVNLSLAFYLFENGILWWLAGLLGAMVGAVWNYGASSVLVWRSQNRQR